MYLISCCLHADQILPKLAQSCNKLSKPVLGSGYIFSITVLAALTTDACIYGVCVCLSI